MTEPKKDVIRTTDAESIRTARTLLRASRHGAMAVIEPGTGAPSASRVGVASDTDGTPLILISGLSAHTGALMADRRCSLLLGEPGKGDPLAHARMTVACESKRLERGSDDWARAERRYLNHNSKAKLYVGLGDFAFFRLNVTGASLNGGFGKAYRLGRDELLTAGDMVAFAAAEQSALDHMNRDHADAVARLAAHFGGATAGGWTMTGLDADGIDLADGDRMLRIFFAEPLAAPGDAHKRLVEMAKQARLALDNAARPRPA